MSRPSRTRRTTSNIDKGINVFPGKLKTQTEKMALARHIEKLALDTHNRDIPIPDIQVRLSEPSRRPTPAQLSPPLGLNLDPQKVINEMNQQEVPQSLRRTTFRKPHPALSDPTHFDSVVSIRNLGTPTAKYAIAQLNSREENSREPYNLRLAKNYSGTPLVSPVGSPLRDEYFPPLINRQSYKDNQAKGKSTKRKPTKRKPTKRKARKSKPKKRTKRRRNKQAGGS